MAIKLRKMLGDVNAPSTTVLMNLIDTQNRETICNWCIDYAWEKILKWHCWQVLEWDHSCRFDDCPTAQYGAV